MKISIKFEGHGHGQALTSEGWLVRSETPSSNGQSNPIARCCAFHNLKHEILLDGRALCRNLLHLCQLWLDQSNFWKPTNFAVVKFLQHSFAVEKYNLLSWRNTFCSVGEIHFAPLQFIWSWDKSWNVWQNINISLCIIRGCVWTMADETMIFLFSIMVGVKNYLMDGLTLSGILSALLKVLSESNNCNWGQWPSSLIYQRWHFSTLKWIICSISIYFCI